MLNNYFEEIIEYPNNNSLLTGLKRGHLYYYVSSSYLDGLINYTKPVFAILLDRYKVKGEEVYEEGSHIIDDGVISISAKIESVWGKLTGDKEYVLHEAVKEKYTFIHTKFSEFQDDVILISKTEQDNEYVVFWYDMDCSDCAIGMFYTEDDFEIIKKNLISSISYKSYEIPKKIFTGFHWLEY